VFPVGHNPHDDWKILFETSSTFHSRIVIRTNRQRVQLVSERGVSSSMFLHDGFPTSRIYHYAFIPHIMFNKPKFHTMLMLGGGGFCLPTYLNKLKRVSVITTVEKDPSLYPLARKFFSAPRQSKFYRVVTKEAVSFLAQDRQCYDIVYIDIGWSKSYKPENMPLDKHIRSALSYATRRVRNPEGFFLANFLTPLDKKGEKWFGSYHALLTNYYKTVFVFADFPNDLKRDQDITVVCSNIPMKDLHTIKNKEILGTLAPSRKNLLGEIPLHLILTQKDNLPD